MGELGAEEELEDSSSKRRGEKGFGFVITEKGLTGEEGCEREGATDWVRWEEEGGGRVKGLGAVAARKVGGFSRERGGIGTTGRLTKGAGNARTALREGFRAVSSMSQSLSEEIKVSGVFE